MVLARTAGCLDFLMKKAIEIWLHYDNFNNDMRFPQSHTWYLLMNVIKQGKIIKKHHNEGPVTNKMDCDDWLPDCIHNYLTGLCWNRHHWMSDSACYSNCIMHWDSRNHILMLTPFWRGWSHKKTSLQFLSFQPFYGVSFLEFCTMSCTLSSDSSFLLVNVGQDTLLFTGNHSSLEWWNFSETLAWFILHVLFVWIMLSLESFKSCHKS